MDIGGRDWLAIPRCRFWICNRVAQFFDILIVWSAAVPPAGVTLRRRFLFAISRLFRRLHTLASLFCTERQLKCFFFNSLRTLAVEHPGGGTP